MWSWTSRHSHFVPLAVPKIVCLLFASHNFDRYAYKHSLNPPLAAVVLIAQTRRAPDCARMPEIKIFSLQKNKSSNRKIETFIWSE